MRYVLYRLYPIYRHASGFHTGHEIVHLMRLSVVSAHTVVVVEEERLGISSTRCGESDVDKIRYFW
jgi:hypothetical protein